MSHYTVAYFSSSPMRKRQTLDTMTQTVSGNDANITSIEGLDANTDYIILVSATNGAGTSTPSTPLHVAAGTRGKLLISLVPRLSSRVKEKIDPVK